jgi:hypothetical protein
MEMENAIEIWHFHSCVWGWEHSSPMLPRINWQVVMFWRISSWSTHCKIWVILFMCILRWLAVWVFPTDVFLDHGLLPCLFVPRGMQLYPVDPSKQDITYEIAVCITRIIHQAEVSALIDIGLRTCQNAVSTNKLFVVIFW